MGSKIKEKIERKIGELQDEDFVGVDIGGFDKRLLIIGDSDISDHLRMQPAAIAYYGMLLRRADATIRRLEAKFDEWWHQVYAKANDELSEERSTKPTVADITGRAISNNKKKYRSKKEKISEAREVRDMLDVWYEAIRQKGFSMDKLVEINREELMTKDSAKSQVGRILGGSKKKGKK